MKKSPTAKPAGKRVKDLPQRMTPHEMAATAMHVWQEQGRKLLDDGGKFEQNIYEISEISRS